MKIKIISDQIKYGNSFDAIARYNGDNKNKYYDFNEEPGIEREVNEFCSRHDVISITPSIATLGNNPPTDIIIYTIVYNEDTRKVNK